jgi:hypothetical protein
MQEVIGRHNYEIYFVDAIEGKLDAELLDELNIFLSSHPDLAEEYEHMREIWSSPVPSDYPATFESKIELHQSDIPISEEQLNELLIGEIEGRISSDDKIRLDKWAAIFPKVATARKYFAATLLHEVSAAFPEKNSLKFDPTDLETDKALLLAAIAENDIKEEQLAAEGFVLHDEAIGKELALLRKIKLQPEHIVFEAKSSLHQSVGKVISLRPIILSFASVAAVLALIFTVIRMNQSGVAIQASMLDIRPNYNIEFKTYHSSKESPQPNSTPHNSTHESVHSAPQLQLPTHTTEEKEIVQRTNSGVQKLVPNPLMVLSVNEDKKLILPAPDMRLVHEQKPIEQNIAGSSKTLTLLDYISQSAAERLENSYAYNLASKQYSRIAEKRSQAISVDQNPENDKMIIRFAGIEIQRDKRKESNNQIGLVGRATRTYRRLTR